jgi:hypothetical protein
VFTSLDVSTLCVVKKLPIAEYSVVKNRFQHPAIGFQLKHFLRALADSRKL